MINDQQSHEKYISVRSNFDVIADIHIPEPTKSLLWVTNENTENIESPLTIKIKIKVSDAGVDVKSDKHNFFSEPSLIWTKLKVESNSELEEKAMYYPSYSGLSPRHRFQYLKWLEDVSQKTNLSYVFLYFYGLERHLLVGDYDSAVKEILKLMKYHDKATFKSYAIHSLIAGSILRKRPDIFEKSPFLSEDTSDLSFALRKISQRRIKAKDILNLCSKAGFYNKLYIKKYPDMFEKELQNEIDVYEKDNGSILDNFDYDSLPKESLIVFANPSIPNNIRTVEFPKITDDTEFKKLAYRLLDSVHQKIKNKIKNSL